MRSDEFIDWEHLRARHRQYLDSGFGGWYALYNAVSVERWLRSRDSVRGA